MSQKNYLDLDGLTIYDRKIKAWINSSTVDITDDAIRMLFKTGDGVYMDVISLIHKTLSDKASMPVIEYQAVDLGLSVKWADRNVGAETIEDNGMYFSWGNTDVVISDGTTISVLVKDALYKYAEIMGITESEVEAFMSQEGWEEIVKTEFGITGWIEGTTFDETTYASTSGGQFTGSTLDTEHDAASQWMGTFEVSGETKTWRMPTVEETGELFSGTDQYGVKDNGEEVPRSAMTNEDTYIGMKFVSKAEGNNNSIFIPFAGSCQSGLLGNEGSNCYVWSSSVSSSSSARGLCFDSSGNWNGVGTFSRYLGRSVRGVCV